MSLWQRLFVAENEVQKNKLASFASRLAPSPTTKNTTPPPPLFLQIQFPLPSNSTPFFSLFLSFLKPTSGYIAQNMLICYAPATPWVKITY